VGHSLEEVEAPRCVHDPLHVLMGIHDEKQLLKRCCKGSVRFCACGKMLTIMAIMGKVC